jgi:hypothetical protein
VLYDRIQLGKGVCQCHNIKKTLQTVTNMTGSVMYPINPCIIFIYYTYLWDLQYIANLILAIHNCRLQQLIWQFIAKLSYKIQ